MTQIPGKNKLSAVLLLQIICSGFFNNLFAGDFGYYLDYTTFKAGQGFTYLEVYFAIPRNVFEYVPSNEKHQAKIKFTVEVFSNDSLISSQSWINLSELDSLAAIKDGELVHEIYGLYLKEGNYRLRTNISDLVSNNAKEKTVDL